MMEDNFSDNDFQLLGRAPQPEKKGDKPSFSPRWKKLLAILVLCFAVGLIAGILYTRMTRLAQQELAVTIFEQEPAVPSADMLDSLLAPYDSVRIAGSAIDSFTVNDIPLTVYYPRNAHARLAMGIRSLHNKQAILVLQAADIRADNGKIVGAFVLKGKPLAWGLSKQGFCGIIHDTITVGVADNSPLFEEATETDGYFFRQYPLVDNHRLVEVNIKTKAIRRALCDVCGRIVVIATQSEESMHDFSQALVDVGVTNAIYLIGGEAVGCATDLEGNRTEWGTPCNPVPKYINCICWEKN